MLELVSLLGIIDNFNNGIFIRHLKLIFYFYFKVSIFIFALIMFCLMQCYKGIICLFMQALNLSLIPLDSEIERKTHAIRKAKREALLATEVPKEDRE